jgi:perosamine synthetase
VKNFIPVNEPLLNGNEKKYLTECIDTGWISSEGPFIKQFEEGMAKKVGRRHGIAVANGTLAIDAAIEALGIDHGDEVIMPTFTIISCVGQILRAGAKPVFVDSDPITWNMNVQEIESKITSKTKAIMVVHIYGLPVDMDPVLQLCAKYSLKLIEDAAEMHGQTYKARPCGSFGDLSIFSFYPNKHITTGEGGMIMVDDETLAKKCGDLRNLCFKPPRRFVHDELGWNMRMTNLQAALGVAQLERLDQFVEIKRRMGSTYTAAFSGMSSLQLPLAETDYAKNIYWVYGMVIRDSSMDADKAMELLAQEGIGTRPFFWPLHEQPVLKKYGFEKQPDCEVASRIARKGFYLPSGLGLTEEQQSRVIEAVKKVFG